MYNTSLTDSTNRTGQNGTTLFVSLILSVLSIVGIWRTFQKAGRHGWASIIPFYNLYTLCKIGGRPGWWLILFFIPFVNIIVYIVLCIDIAKAFGKTTLFAILGLFLFSFIGYIMLGFGGATYDLARAETVSAPIV